MVKISVIGAGHVGSTTAQRIAEKNLADELVLVDVVDGLPQGKALDLYQSASVEKFSTRIIGSNNYSDIENSQVVVITAGLARKPGMTREDLLRKNAEIIKSVAENIKIYAKDAIVIVVTNPLDVMAQLVLKVTEFPSKRVFGMAGMLDTSRLRAFVALEVGCKPAEVSAMILGSHGDSMLAIRNRIKVKGKKLINMLDESKVSELIERARNGGAEIVKYLKTGSAYYAPASGIAYMVGQIVKDKKKTIPCSCYLQGEYGLDDVYIGVPCKLGNGGVEKIVKIKLTKEERESLHKSAQIVKDNFNLVKEEPESKTLGS